MRQKNVTKDSPLIVKYPAIELSTLFLFKIKKVDRPLFNHPCWTFAVR